MSYLLGAIRPAQAPPSSVTVKEGRIWIEHASDPETAIIVTFVQGRAFTGGPFEEILVECPPGHHHCKDSTEALRLIEAMLVGKCELHITWRGGDWPAKVTIVLLENGERRPLVTSRFLSNPLRRKREEIQRISFL